MATRAETTRQTVLETAAGMFWRRNYHGVSVDEVADAARVNKATIYRYFPSKAALADAVLDRAGSSVFTCVFEPVFARQSAPGDRLRGIYDAFYAAHHDVFAEEGDQYGCPIAGIALELGTEIPELRRQAADIFARVETYFWRIAEGALDSGKAGGWDHEILARTLLLLIQGALVTARVERRSAPILEARAASLSLIGEQEIVP